MTSPVQLAETVRTARSALIVLPTALGDVVMATCLPAALKQVNPSLTISWVVDKALADVLADCPVVDQVFSYTRKGQSSVFRALDLMRTSKAVRAQHPDFALALRNRFAVMIALGLCGAPVRFAMKGQGLFGRFARTDLLSPQQNLTGVSRFLSMLEPFQLDINEASPILTPNREWLRRSEELLASEGLASDTPYAVAAVGSSRPSKDWSVESHTEVIKWLATELSLPTILVGALKDEATAASIQAAAKEQVINLCGRTSLRLLTALSARARVTYGPDTGPLYVAAATKTPVVILYGPFSGGRLPPQCLHEDIIGKDGLMTNISPIQVIEALERVVTASSHPGNGTS